MHVWDCSTQTTIECVVETLKTPLPYGSIAAINISIVNSSVLFDDDKLQVRG